MATKYVITGKECYDVNEGSLALVNWEMTAQFVAAQLANPVLGLQDKDVIINRAVDFTRTMFELRKPKPQDNDTRD